MPEDDNLETQVRKLTVEHAQTRWLSLRLDNDVKEIRLDIRKVRNTQLEHSTLLREHSTLLREHSTLLREHSARFDAVDATLQEHSTLLQEHSARFDSVDLQLRSLTQMVGNVLERLPEKPGNN
jgi:chromosome segregation ATPase